MSRNWLVALVVLAACQPKSPELELMQLDTIQLENATLKVEVLADSLNVPWDLDVDSESFLWVAEQEGKVSRINLKTGDQKYLLQIPEVWKVRTSGLLGMVAHPDFSKNPFLYLNYTVKNDSLIYSKLVRYRYKEDSLINPEVLLEIEGGTSHNGSRLAFGPDGKLYWATGDKHDYTYSQNREKLNGKILRFNPDGSIPSDNPDPTSPVWAWGFRNMQGLVFSSKGLLFTSEHGDAIEDEVNLIRKGGNFGWPAIEGKHDLPAEIDFASANQTIEPIRSWTPVIAPAGMTYYGSEVIPDWKNTLLLTTLKGKSLRILFLNESGDSIDGEEILFENLYGRLRDVAVGPDGAIYLSTSNQDWNPQPGFPLPGDDKILKISPSSSLSSNPISPVKASEILALDGKQLYKNYCASCHKEDGSGVAEVFPALVNSQVVLGDTRRLIELLLKGQVSSDGAQAMPDFSFLDNREAAEILSYIRTSWGNSASSISSTQIESLR
ncbi:PQQ-dependent sugar dehydrogenase [Algoriphagus litoralis]|uniref:PQQ-dependent sugar dehydrogenase n=1 Tax=Algoriphagus litoralis TaxID=2202829 RepID=UPI000DBA9596|nr:PQQ-dependent sugar dehydrogenase [Algoriphagus litoralis]